MKRLFTCFCLVFALSVFGTGCSDTAEPDPQNDEAEVEEDVEAQQDMEADIVGESEGEAVP